MYASCKLFAAALSFAVIFCFENNVFAADPSGWGEPGLSPAPSEHYAAAACLLSLSDMYSSGVLPAEIRRRAIEAGLSEEVLAPFFALTGEGQAVQYDMPAPYDPGPGIYDQSMRAFDALMDRFSTTNIKQRAVGVMLLTARPDQQPVMVQLERDAAELLSEPDFCAPPAPTGDALYDRYAQAVALRMDNWVSPETDAATRDARPPISLAALPDSELAAWEAEFGADPRYWELRFFCARTLASEAKGNPQALGLGFKEPHEFLAEAGRRNLSRPATLIAEFADTYEYRGRDNDKTQTAPADYNSEIAFLQSACNLSPEQAWPHYLRAWLLNADGRLDEALAELKQGNACPQKLYPLCFPLDIAARPADPSRPPGGAAVCGAIFTAALSEPTWGIESKGFAKDLSARAQATGDLSLLDPVTEFLQGQSQDHSVVKPVMPLIYTVILGLCVTGGEEFAPGALSPETLTMLRRQRAAVQLSKQVSNASGHRRADMISGMTLLTGPALLRGVFTVAYLGFLEQSIGENHQLDVLAMATSSPLSRSADNSKLSQLPPVSQWFSIGRSEGKRRARGIQSRADRLLGVRDPQEEFLRQLMKQYEARPAGAQQ